MSTSQDKSLHMPLTLNSFLSFGVCVIWWSCIFCNRKIFIATKRDNALSKFVQCNERWQNFVPRQEWYLDGSSGSLFYKFDGIFWFIFILYIWVINRWLFFHFCNMHLVFLYSEYKNELILYKPRQK